MPLCLITFTKGSLPSPPPQGQGLCLFCSLLCQGLRTVPGAGPTLQADTHTHTRLLDEMSRHAAASYARARANPNNYSSSRSIKRCC